MWELHGNFGIWQKQGMLLVFGLFSDVLRVHGRQKHRTFLCCLVLSTPNSWVPNCPTASTAAVSRVVGRLVVVSEALNIPVVGFILQPHREIEPVSAGYLGIDDLWWYCVDVWFVAANWTMTIIMFSSPISGTTPQDVPLRPIYCSLNYYFLDATSRLKRDHREKPGKNPSCLSSPTEKRGNMMNIDLDMMIS